MRSTITISVPRELLARLDQASREEGVARSEIVRDSLRHSLFARNLRKLRGRMVPRARALGIFTDDDVFNLVS